MDGWNLDDLIGNDPKARERIRKADAAKAKADKEKAEQAARRSDHLSSLSSLSSQKNAKGSDPSGGGASDDLSTLMSLIGASGKRAEISRIVAYNGSCRSEGAQP